MAGCGVGEGGPADAKDGFESWMSLINRRPICLLKGPFPRGPGLENVKRVMAGTRRQEK